MSWTTPDLCDRFPELAVAAPLLRHYGGRTAFHGPIATIGCHEDNSRVREQVLGQGHGRVLVVDGGGSLRCALLGDLLASHALENGWAGVLVHGAVRDVEVLATLPLGVMALAACPRRSEKRGLGEVGGRLAFAGVVFEPGHWLYADANGIVLAQAALPLEPVV